MPRTIRHGQEYWKLHEDGAIERPGLVQPNAETWRVSGAVRLNNFGFEVEYFTLTDVLSGKIQWRHSNGKQRVHVRDVDHGSSRIWMSPEHEIY